MSRIGGRLPLADQARCSSNSPKSWEHEPGIWSAEKGPRSCLSTVSGCPPISWFWTVPALARQFRVAAPDLLDNGFTGAGPYSGGPPQPLIVDHLLRLADHLKFDRFSIVGSSLGAAIALLTYFKAPDRIDRLDPGGAGPSAEPSHGGYGRVRGIVPQWAIRVAQPDLRIVSCPDGTCFLRCGARPRRSRRNADDDVCDARSARNFRAPNGGTAQSCLARICRARQTWSCRRSDACPGRA